MTRKRRTPASAELRTPSPGIATLRVQIEVPTLPNFVRMRGCDSAVDIADIPDETLRQLGEVWTGALVARAKTRRDMKG